MLWTVRHCAKRASTRKLQKKWYLPTTDRHFICLCVQGGWMTRMVFLIIKEDTICFISIIPMIPTGIPCIGGMRWAMTCCTGSICRRRLHRTSRMTGMDVSQEMQWHCLTAGSFWCIPASSRSGRKMRRSLTGRTSASQWVTAWIMRNMRTILWLMQRICRRDSADRISAIRNCGANPMERTAALSETGLRTGADRSCCFPVRTVFHGNMRRCLRPTTTALGLCGNARISSNLMAARYCLSARRICFPRDLSIITAMGRSV